MVPAVKNIKPTAKITVNPAKQSNKSLVECMLDRTVIAATGSKQATTIETPAVNRSALSRTRFEWSLAWLFPIAISLLS